MLLTTASIIEIQTALSSERFGRYLNDCTNDINRACNLYTWNMAISGAFLPWLNITEVVLRNRIHTVLTSIHGPEWPWESGFEKTLPDPRQGFNPLAELKASRKKYDNSRQTGKVIADLKFAFWQRMPTKKQLLPLWNKHLYTAFPYADPSRSIDANRKMLYDYIEQIRGIRNRIAHHKPIHNRNLNDDYDKILKFISTAHSKNFIDWLKSGQSFANPQSSYLEILLANKP